MSENRKPKALHMKQHFGTMIRLSGTVGEDKYRIGVPNPCYYPRRDPAFGPKHLRALWWLLSLRDEKNLAEQFEIRDCDLALPFPKKDGTKYLGDVLGCWLRINKPGRVTEISTLASVWVYNPKEGRIIFVRLSRTMVELLKKLAANA
jgi:hypothetical protein